MDVNGGGYLVVTPPGGAARLIKIERGIVDSWNDGVHVYQVSLLVSIFRPRVANFISIRDMTTGGVIWEKRINEFFRLTYEAGEPVNLAGRAYRLYYFARPSLGLCFMYDDTSAGGHNYKFYMVPLEQIQGAAPTSHKIYGADIVKLLVSPDLATLHIIRWWTARLKIAKIAAQ